MKSFVSSQFDFYKIRSVSSALGSLYIRFMFADSSDCGFDPGSNIFDAHGRGGSRTVDGLAVDKGNVHKTASYSGVFPFQSIKDAIHQMIAYKGSGSIRYAGGKSCLTDRLHHSFDGQGREVSRGSVLKDGEIDGLITFIIFNTGVIRVPQ